ncbi:MBL fold metallo-hydrolase [Micromonospora sp. AP08]|uniref:MBL fold metallo-hydrolase n=1 Tax=Micromonospora sp. AP08 TaxID=2604467 RepID=UPI002101DDA7|nr:MBL fold metallo-hydrolase [Micromonospora sp. AP08]
MTLRHLAGRVWLFPGDPDPFAVRPTVAVVADDRGSVIIDAGQSPAHAREVQAALAVAGLPEPRWLVYTHHHWDHVWGACAWPGVEIVGHESGVALLRAEAARPWSHRYLREQVGENPRLGHSFRARALAVDSWDGFAVLPPTRTFADELTLPTGVDGPDLALAAGLLDDDVAWYVSAHDEPLRLAEARAALAGGGD